MQFKPSNILIKYMRCSVYSLPMFLLSPSVQAIEFSSDSYKGSVDTTLTYGISSRLEDRDMRLVGIANGGSAFSVNGDNGNLNFDEGTVSNIVKLTSEVELNFQDYGFFIRASGLYDEEIMNGSREHIDLSDDAKDMIGSDLTVLDAYFWSQYDWQGKPIEMRVGNQVLSWGESTFIQNGVNIINPIDVGKIRVPGAELREALLPVPILSASIGATENSSLEAFYQLAWESTDVDPSGSYFNTADFVGAGGERVQLGFGAVPEGALLGVTRDPDVEAKDAGQFGLAYRLYAPSLNDTEFGFYYINYHSRVPLLGANTSSAAITSAAQALLPDVSAATATYATGLRYFLEYPEDISLFGASFNTSLGTTGIALQGELSHKQNVPLQIDDVELLFAALSPLYAPLPGFSTQFDNYGPDQVIHGFIERDVSQLQVTGTTAIPQTLGASQLVVVAELGYTYVHDMPDKDELRLDSAGTNLGGNPNTAPYQSGGAAGIIEDAKHFADANSWGYRLLAKLSYDNAIGSVNLSPRLAYSHDVEGNTPGPGGNFLEGRKALTLGMTADYLNQWSGDLSYTRFDGAGRYNLINDRDFVAFNLKYAF